MIKEVVTTRRAVAVLAAIGSAGLMTIAATSASASTTGCLKLNGCGTQTDADASYSLSLAARNGSSASGTHIVGRHGDGANKEFDFYWTHPSAWSSVNGALAEYAPSGKLSNECMTAVGSAVELKKCTGSLTQEWIASGPDNLGGYAFTNGANSLMLRVQQHGRRYAELVSPPSGNPGAREQWTFAESS
jgi:hypothetical protein